MKNKNIRRAALVYHAKPNPGKIEVNPTTKYSSQRDLALAYSPGVAFPCLEIEKDPSNVYKYTFGGYCFLNNAAIAAQYLRDQGAQRAAILDIDFHHGNGTQDIFYDRDDVLFCSLHGEPQQAFPYFLGYADETGSGQGLGYNLNYPMPRDTSFIQWQQSLTAALAKIDAFAPEYLILSLGVDTFENDPISFFKLTTADYFTTGAMIAELQIPTLFVMEGGYDIDEVGINVVEVLKGFESVK